MPSLTMASTRAHSSTKFHPATERLCFRLVNNTGVPSTHKHPNGDSSPTRAPPAPGQGRDAAAQRGDALPGGPHAGAAGRGGKHGGVLKGGEPDLHDSRE